MSSESISIFEATILGIVQGLTEFIPISSSAHLRVVPTLFGWGDPGAAYSAVLQLGSVVALLTYFAKPLISIGKGTIISISKKDYKSTDFKISTGIIIGTIPICVIGFALKDILEQQDSPLRALGLIAVVSIIMGLLLIVAELFGNQKRGLDDLRIRDGIAVGLGQALALIPGCSRSGSTLTVAMLLGLNRADAARFSFMLGIPAVVLSGLLELVELFEIGLENVGILGLVAGLITSTIFSYISIVWMIRFLEKHSTWWFVGYRVAFGIVILLALNAKLIS